MNEKEKTKKKLELVDRFHETAKHLSNHWEAMEKEFELDEILVNWLGGLDTLRDLIADVELLVAELEDVEK